jgi:YVTN family beta-propeller protein
MMRVWIAASLAALVMCLVGAEAGAQNAYITNAADGTVSVIATATNSVIGAPVTVGQNPLGLAVTPNGSTVYVANSASNTVSVIATASNTVIGAAIAVGNNPLGVAVTPDSSKVYVTNNADATVSVIATATNIVIGAPIAVGNSPQGVAVTPDGSTVYVTNLNDGTVSAITTATNTVIGAPIPVGSFPVGVAVTPDSRTVYVANAVSNTVSVIATATNTVIGAPIPVGNFPVGLAVTPDGSAVYVTNESDGTVSVIATATNTVIGSAIAVGNSPQGVALTPDGSTVYVANNADGTMSVIATATNTVIGGPIFVGNKPAAFGQFIGPRPVPAVASVLPGGRSVQAGTTATVFASMLNFGSASLTGCGVTLPGSAPAGLSMAYQTTNSQTNAPTGSANTPVTIPANGLQSFLLSFDASTPLAAPALALQFSCTDMTPVASIPGVNTVDLLFSSSPIPDVIALAATVSSNGIVSVPLSGAGAFAVASDNVGSSSSLIVSLDTGGAALPLTATLCQTGAQAQCLAPPAATVTLTDSAGGTPTFSVFLTASAPIALNPASSRLYVRFKDSNGVSHGSTSVAVQTG